MQDFFCNYKHYHYQTSKKMDVSPIKFYSMHCWFHEHSMEMLIRTVNSVWPDYMLSLVQNYCNYIGNSMQLQQFCTKASNCTVRVVSLFL